MLYNTYNFEIIGVLSKFTKTEVTTIQPNKNIKDGNGGSNFYLNNGLMKKLELLWEEPDSSEVDFI